MAGSPPLDMVYDSSYTDCRFRWDNEDMRQKPGSAKEINFGFYKAVGVQNLTAATIAEEIKEAREKNPEGVLIAGFSIDNMAHVAGYLNFKDSAVTVKWFEDEDKLPSILENWRYHKQSAFGCPVRDGIKPSDKEFGAEKLFKFIMNLTPKQTACVIGDKFPVTHVMLDVKNTQDDPGFISYLNAMHRVISTYSEHFPDDTPTNPREIHSRENWYRALMTLRVYWSTHREARAPRKKSLVVRVAVKPLWIDLDHVKGNGSADVDENADYANYKEKEFDDIFNLENDGSVCGDDHGEHTENFNVQEVENLHIQLNRTGDISKEAKDRAQRANRQERKPVTEEQLRVYISNMRENMKKWMAETKAVEGPTKDIASDTIS
ncbi:0b3dcad3-d160-47d2-a6ed-65fa2d78d0c6 [Sclerotinia trifoliorum]|uniref:0b3dcad3-d160-47d2-a6ed-65fa2d78d0c6 n=1 Tax=Sclerotinia trifoliorum TaxID=28548 RepID=A0A8H2W0W0_9HELO|nr:0b3dcad3-d160-47d2-a6ed-65fa2d78d0c6 [Sclerotinia trifoliorum]